MAPVGEGRIATMPGFNAGDSIVGWAGNGREHFVISWSVNSGRVDSLDVRTGRRIPFRTIGLSDPAGLAGATRVHVSPDGGAYVYSAIRDLNTLIVVDGLK